MLIGALYNEGFSKKTPTHKKKKATKDF